jgi:PBP1b-binding outer membrane lipoprotein LpoB
MKIIALVVASTLMLAACGGGKEGVTECEKVFGEITAAVDKANNPQTSKMIKDQLEAAKQGWSSVSDQKQLAESCKATAAQMKPMLDALPK